MADMASFVDLPVELIRLIASYSSYDSITSLSCTNSRFLAACQDWTVYKGLLHQRHHETFQHVLQIKPRNKSLWRQFSFAESKTDIANADADGDFLSWAPQLLALHHPFGSTIDISRLLKCLDQHPSGPAARAYAFCFCVRALSFDLLPDGSVDSFYSALKVNYPAATTTSAIDLAPQSLCASVSNLCRIGPLWTQDRAMASQFSLAMVDQIHTVALKALGLLNIEIKSATVRDALILKTPYSIAQSHHERSSQFEFPRSSQDISFTSFMNLPNLHTENSANQFTTCHLEQMATKSFLEDGEWCGVEFESRAGFFPSSRITCLSPLKFDVTSDDPAYEAMEVQSHLLDSLEPYTPIRMSIRKSTGLVLLTVQRDKNLPSVHWQGVLTPFGVVGTTTTTAPGHWFWLWKTSWGGKYQTKYDWTKLWGRGSMQVVRRAMSTWQQR